jgi:hypothetical protein
MSLGKEDGSGSMGMASASMSVALEPWRRVRLWLYFERFPKRDMPGFYGKSLVSVNGQIRNGKIITG